MEQDLLGFFSLDDRIQYFVFTMVSSFCAASEGIACSDKIIRVFNSIACQINLLLD